MASSEFSAAAHDVSSSGISWAAVVGGAFVAAAISLLMLALGATHKNSVARAKTNYPGTWSGNSTEPLTPPTPLSTHCFQRRTYCRVSPPLGRLLNHVARQFSQRHPLGARF